MNAVGIDISKGKNTVAVARPLGEIVSKPFEVRHTSDDIALLIQYLRTLDGDTRIVMKHTGRYYEPMLRSLAKAGFFVCAVNPKLIKDYGNNSLRKVKTDKADALKIARYTLDNWQDLCQYTIYITQSIKNNESAIRFLLKAENRLQKQSHRAVGYDISRLCLYDSRSKQVSAHLLRKSKRIFVIHLQRNKYTLSLYLTDTARRSVCLALFLHKSFFVFF